MGTLISSNALTDSERRVLFLKRRYDLDIRSGLNGMRISWAASILFHDTPKTSTKVRRLTQSMLCPQKMFV